MPGKKILLISTGGTIASEKTPGGIKPSFGAGKLLELAGSVLDIDTLDLLRVDSSNMQPEDWRTIARAAYSGLESHDGVVISHGTHTMAYTAAALTFMMQNIPGPVVLTGAQVPAGESGSDGPRNLRDALMFAGDGAPGVFIVFHGKVIRGCRAVKTSTVLLDAFESINHPLVASIQGEKITYYQRPHNTKKKPVLRTDLDNSVFLLKLVPGIEPAVLDTVPRLGFRAVVIECFGAGGVPFTGRDLLAKIRSLVEGGTIVALSTQCLGGGVDLTIYDVGRKSLDAGVLSGLDMTTEALVVKLMWALGQSGDRNVVTDIMNTNYADEFTPGYSIRFS